MNLVGSIETETNNTCYDKKRRFFKQIDFLLCESCFWCASSLSSSPSYHLSNEDTVSKCPICNKHALKQIPIPNKGLEWGEAFEEAIKMARLKEKAVILYSEQVSIEQPYSVCAIVSNKYKIEDYGSRLNQSVHN